jgi:hypothetical protein
VFDWDLPWEGETMRRLSRATLLVLLVCLSASANALTLDVSGGQLVGAFNVDVGGDLYDVVFTDGTCIALFSGCDSNSDFAFTTEVAGLAAATALAEQVFLDGPEGNFDTLPGLTFDCGSATVCGAYIPFATNGTTVQVARMENRAPPGSDRIQANRLLLGLSFDLSSDSATYAVFTAVPVPEPSATSLFTLGLGLVGFAAKRRRVH